MTTFRVFVEPHALNENIGQGRILTFVRVTVLREVS